MDKIAENTSKLSDPARMAVLSALLPGLGAGAYSYGKTQNLGDGLRSGVATLLGAGLGQGLLGMAAGRSPFKHSAKFLKDFSRFRGGGSPGPRPMVPPTPLPTDTRTQSLARALGAMLGGGTTGYLITPDDKNKILGKSASFTPNITNMYHKALFEKVAAAIDFSKMAPDQNAAFRQGTATNFNSKSWLDRNKMYRKMQGEADWADNAKARAMGSNFQYNAPAAPSASPAAPSASPAAPRATPKALPPVASPYKNPRPGNIRDQSVMQALNPVHQATTALGLAPTYTQAMHNQPIKPGLSSSMYKAQQKAFANELPKGQFAQNVRQLVEERGLGALASRVPFVGNALYPGADGK